VAKKIKSPQLIDEQHSSVSCAGSDKMLLPIYTYQRLYLPAHIVAQEIRTGEDDEVMNSMAQFLIVVSSSVSALPGAACFMAWSVTNYAIYGEK